MSKPNAYLAKQEALRQKCFDVGYDIAGQQFFDLLCLVLNDREIMKNNAFGAQRLNRIRQAIWEMELKYHAAWVRHPESDYYQVKLDEALERIFGKIDPFNERYPYIGQDDYSKPFKEKKRR